MLDDKLRQFGLTRNESVIYLELLKLGAQPVSVLAKRLKMNRSTTYSTLQALGQKGLVGRMRKNKITYYSAADPNSLVGYLDSKVRTFDYFRNEMISLIPKFRSLRGESKVKPPLISHFSGFEAVEELLLSAFTCGSQCRAYLSLEKFLEHGLEEAILNYRNLLVHNQNTRLKAIVPEKSIVRAFFKSVASENSSKLVEICALAELEFSELFENQLCLYDNKVAIMRLEPSAEYAIVIDNLEIFTMHKRIFDLVWHQYKQ